MVVINLQVTNQICLWSSFMLIILLLLNFLLSCKNRILKRILEQYQSAELKTFKAQNVTLELKKKTSFHVNQSSFIVMDKDVGICIWILYSLLVYGYEV